MSSRPIRRASALASLVWVLSTPAFAQSGTSTISGVVRDSTDAPLPGAVVKVINEDTGGLVVMSTRWGTSDLRATLFESLRNDALDARNVFCENQTPHPAQSVRRHGGRAAEARQDVLLRIVGAHTAAHERRRRQHRPDSAESSGEFCGSAQRRGPDRDDLSTSPGSLWGRPTLAPFRVRAPRGPCSSAPA